MLFIREADALAILRIIGFAHGRAITSGNQAMAETCVDVAARLFDVNALSEADRAQVSDVSRRVAEYWVQRQGKGGEG